MQIAPGVYNDEALEAMDFVLERARLLGLKIMLSFADNWKYQGALLPLSFLQVFDCWNQ